MKLLFDRIAMWFGSWWHNRKASEDMYWGPPTVNERMVDINERMRQHESGEDHEPGGYLGEGDRNV